TEAQLRERIAAYEREEAWAPKWVGEELREASLAAREYREQAVLRRAAAEAERDPERRAQAHAAAAAYEATAEHLAQVQQELERIDSQRAAWWLHTAEARAHADAARAELEARGVDVEPDVARVQTADVAREADHDVDRAGDEVEPD